MRVSRVGTEELAPTAEVTVTVHKSDGTSVSKTTTVGFYERSAKVGDYVYADGTWSNIYDDTRTIVGICWYIDPKDRMNRLLVSLKCVKKLAWGLNTEITLTDDAEFNALDITGLKNWNQANVRYGELRDQETGDADGFKIFSIGDIRSHIGFTNAERTVGKINEGDVVPFGQYETLLIIEHRNKILRDSGINLPVPAATASKTEMESFEELVFKNSSFDLYYYPAASCAYAYEPKVKVGEVLSDKFKAHNWFLPSGGDGARIGWYMSQVENDELGIFEKPIRLGLVSRMIALIDEPYGGWQTSCEQLAASAVGCLRDGFANSYRGYGEKNCLRDVYPICKF